VVTGAGSQWTADSIHIGGSSDIGSYGLGTLDVLDGGLFSCDYAEIAFSGSAEGTVRVSGASAEFSSDAGVYVGGSSTEAGGAGTLTVESGGLVNVGTMLKLWPDGTLSICGGGQVTCESFDSSSSSTLNLTGGILKVDGGTFNWGGGELCLNGADTPTLVLAGEDTDGVTSSFSSFTLAGDQKAALRVEGGATLRTWTSDMARNFDGRGAAVVTGAGSQWTNVLDVNIGSRGFGVLDVLDGGQFFCDNARIACFESAEGTVTVSGANAEFSCDDSVYVGGSNFTAGGKGTLTVETAGLVDAGFRLKLWPDGTLNVDGGAVRASYVSITGTLNFRSGILELTGGALTMDGALVIPIDGTLRGRGTVYPQVVGLFSSSIEATGDLVLGDANSYEGFLSDGRLSTGDNVVTINDRNEAVLGSLTQLGTDIADGTLVADNGLLVEFGKNVVGRGTVDTPDDPLVPLMNNGAIIGDSPCAIELTGYVKGFGRLENVTISGTLSPGLSPVRMYATNLEIASNGKLLMELGGLFGGSECDQLYVAGELRLGGTLQVVLIDEFAPEVGNTFDILDFDDLNGTEFDAIELPELAGRKAWDTSALYTDGVIGVIRMLDGDTDIDWDVDVHDLHAFVAAFGMDGDRQTDFNEDGKVDLEDFALMRANLGAGVGASPGGAPEAATPEPATLILLAGGLPVLLRFRRRLN